MEALARLSIGQVYSLCMPTSNQNGHYLYPAQQQQLIGQMPYNAGLQQQQQQDHLLQQHQQQQPPFQQQPQAHALMPFLHSGMQNGQYMQPPPSGQPQSMSWTHQSNLQEGPMQGLASVPQQMPAELCTHEHAKPAQESPATAWNKSIHAAPVAAATCDACPLQKAPGACNASGIPGAGITTRHSFLSRSSSTNSTLRNSCISMQGPFIMPAVCHLSSPGSPQVDNQGFSQPPTPGVISSPATKCLPGTPAWGGPDQGVWPLMMTGHMERMQLTRLIEPQVIVVREFCQEHSE